MLHAARRFAPLHHLGTTAIAAILLWLSVACASTKHVPQGKLLLDKTELRIDDPSEGNNVADLMPYLRQTENHKVLGGLKLQLALYNISGHDSSRWFNRWIRRIGTPPVIYDSALTAASVRQLQTALRNRGFMHNSVSSTVTIDSAKRKARVRYNIHEGLPHIIRHLTYDIADDTLQRLIMADSAAAIHTGEPLNTNRLDRWRQHITDNLRRQGYYAFGKDYITFRADTAADSREVDLTLTVNQPAGNTRIPYYTSHRPFHVRKVVYITNYNPVAFNDGTMRADTLQLDHFTLIRDHDDKYLRWKVIDECNFIRAGQPYNTTDIDRTYQALSRLGIIRHISIDTRALDTEIDGKAWVDIYVLLQRDKAQTVSASLEGTNSEGDLGFGIGIDYQHRNLFHGSERFNAKFRASYQSLSGNLTGLINNNYSEYSGEIGINYPKFKFPFLRADFKRRIRASTEWAINYDHQRRPEYTRIIAGAAWRYVWTQRQARTRHTLNLLDLSYVYLPRSRANFLDSIANPLLRYSYENHLIMRLGYNIYHTNKLPGTITNRRQQTNVYTWRAAAETAGNLLYTISKIRGQHRNDGDAYKVFGIRYAQYVKAEADYALTHVFDRRSSLAIHVGVGVAIPYGNSTVLPFEKRFYAGGANGVRGWGVRTLGPGNFDASNTQSSFIYQCGDIRFDASVEYRVKLFWVIELGAFIDAGNIWTIRNYEDQPGGVFKPKNFFKQLAMAYGAGLRLDFNYFLLRFDLGMKAHNPAIGQEHWPLVHPNWRRDHAFHFSVGYPF